MSTDEAESKTHTDSLKHRIFEILEGSTLEADPTSRAFGIFISVLIFLNILAVVLETVESVNARYGYIFRAFELFSVAVFTIEYVLRLWSCTADPRYARPVGGRFRFAMTPLGLVDLIAILPYYLPMFAALDLRFMRVLRLLRVFLLFKMVRYSESLKILRDVLREEKEELVIAVFMVAILLVLVSSFMYFLEHDSQPVAFSSIPAAMWWGVTTLTTVGYGDIYPVTPLGKFLGSIAALLGIGMFALPAAILSSGFVEEIQRKRGKHLLCPHCGKDVRVPETTRQ